MRQKNQHEKTISEFNQLKKSYDDLFDLSKDLEKEALKFKLYLQNKIYGKILGPVSAPIFRLKRKYRVRLLIRGPKTLKLQNSLSSTISKYKFSPGIKLSVDVDPISFN